MRAISEVTTSIARGDLSKTIVAEAKGETLELKDAINTMVEQLDIFATEITRVALEVGTQGKFGGQAVVKGVGGIWKDLTDNVNTMAANLTGQVRDISEVTTAIAKGDLSMKITAQVEGETLELKNTINTWIDLLNCFTSEVTRIAREVGTEGKLGGKTNIQGISGHWRELACEIDTMAANLTKLIRSATTAIQSADRTPISMETSGELLEFKNAVNGRLNTVL